MVNERSAIESAVLLDIMLSNHSGGIVMQSRDSFNSMLPERVHANLN